MKLIKTYVRPMMVDQVVHALEEVGASRLTAIDVRVMGNEVPAEDCCVSVEYGTTYTKMVKLEIICFDDKTQKIVGVIEGSARTGKQGDGLIVISPIEEVVRIRTGEEEQRHIK